MTLSSKESKMKWKVFKQNEKQLDLGTKRKHEYHWRKQVVSITHLSGLKSHGSSQCSSSWLNPWTGTSTATPAGMVKPLIVISLSQNRTFLLKTRSNDRGSKRPIIKSTMHAYMRMRNIIKAIKM